MNTTLLSITESRVAYSICLYVYIIILIIAMSLR